MEEGAKMYDEFSIQQTINRYSVGASRADWDAVLATFVPDGIWEIPGLGAKFEGLESIRGGMAHFSGTTDYLLQLNSPAVISSKSTSCFFSSRCRLGTWATTPIEPMIANGAAMI